MGGDAKYFSANVSSHVKVVNNGELSVWLAPETIYALFYQCPVVVERDNATSEWVVAGLNIRGDIVGRKVNTRPKFTITLPQTWAGFR